MRREKERDWVEPTVSNASRRNEFFPHEQQYVGKLGKVTHIRIKSDNVLFLHEVRVFDDVATVREGKSR